MILVAWLVLLVSAGAAGALVVWYLTVHPVRMGLAMALVCLALAVVIGMVGPGFAALAAGSRWVPAGAALLALLAGYWAMTLRVLGREDERPLPALTRDSGDPGNGHTAVIYFTHGEPELYDPIGWLNQFREFDEQRIPFVPVLVRPLFVRSLREHYLIVGRSEHRRTHQRMLAALEAGYREQGEEDMRFYLAFLDDNPRPDAALIQALNEGASRVVVAEVFLTVSNHTAEGEHQLRGVPSPASVPVVYTPPLWDSSALQSMFVARANASLGTIPRDRTAILLVGHGQPDAWDVLWPTETEHELEFRRRVLRLFEQDGYRSDLLGIAWMEFKEPHPAPLVERLVAAGAEQVLYFSAAISAESLHSQYDVPALIGKARVPAGTRTVNLGAWNDDPLVIAAIRARVDEALATMALPDGPASEMTTQGAALPSG